MISITNWCKCIRVTVRLLATLWVGWIDFESVRSGLKTEEAVEHDLRDEDALEELLVQAEAARRRCRPASCRARDLCVVRAVAALGLTSRRTRRGSPGAAARHRRARRSSSRAHEVVIGEAQHRAAVLHLVAPRDASRDWTSPRSSSRGCAGWSRAGRSASGRCPSPVEVSPSTIRRPLIQSRIASGLLRRGEVVVDGLVVEEGEAVVVQDAVEIDRAEAAGLLVPEPFRAVVLHLLARAGAGRPGRTHRRRWRRPIPGVRRFALRGRPGPAAQS